jgi:REP element-mobilizing transposase RayT
MPQALAAVYVHLVFSTKDRRPFLAEKTGCIPILASKDLECAPIRVGGVEDHVHLLSRLGRTITQADWVKELKRASSLWIKEQSRHLSDFHWQNGYACFSVSKSNLGQEYSQSGRTSSAHDFSG